MLVIIGGAGFIGSNLVASLAAGGERSLVIVDHFGSDEKWRNLSKVGPVELIAPPEVWRFLDIRSKEVRAVVHLGARTDTMDGDCGAIVRDNISFTQELWRWCERNRKPIVIASSAATFGDGSEGFHDREDLDYVSRLVPLNPYAWSKQIVDMFVLSRVSHGQCPKRWVILKFFNVYGPNEWHKGEMTSIAYKAFERISKGEPVRLFKSDRSDVLDGDQKRDFVFVADVVSVLRWALQEDSPSGMYSVGTGWARSFREVVEIVGRCLGRKPAIEFHEMPSFLKRRYQSGTVASIEKLRRAGYIGRFASIEEGIERYVKSFLQRSDPYAGSSDYGKSLAK